MSALKTLFHMFLVIGASLAGMLWLTDIGYPELTLVITVVLLVGGMFYGTYIRDRKKP